jgi:hypothetical protein
MTSKLAKLHTDLITMDPRPTTPAIAGVRQLRDNLPAALRMVAEEGRRIVVCRHHLPVAAAVPMTDYFFVVELQKRLFESGYRNGHPVIDPSRVADAIMGLRQNPYRPAAAPTPSQALHSRPRSWPDGGTIHEMDLLVALESWQRWRAYVMGWTRDRAVRGIRWECGHPSASRG